MEEVKRKIVISLTTVVLVLLVKQATSTNGDSREEVRAVNAWSSTYYWMKSVYGPQLAWEGGSTGSSGFFLSREERKPWLMIELNKPTTITSVTIINRKDCCGERLRGLAIRGGMKNDFTNAIIGRFRGPGRTKGVHRIPLTRATKAKYLMFQLEGSNSMTLQVNGIRLNRIRGKSCWKECGRKGGHCPKVCGENGYCCRQGYKDCDHKLISDKRRDVYSHSCIQPDKDDNEEGNGFEDEEDKDDGQDDLRRSVLYVNGDNGSLESACGAKSSPCKFLQQAINNCERGGKVFMESSEKIRKEIKITRDITIIGSNGATIDGNLTDAAVFKIIRPVIFRVINLNFSEAAILEIHSKSSVHVTNCSVKHLPKPHRTWLPNAIFQITPDGKGSTLKVTNSAFVGWQAGCVLRLNFQFELLIRITFERCRFVDHVGIILWNTDNVALAVRQCSFTNTHCRAIQVNQNYNFRARYESTSLVVNKSSFVNSKRCVSVSSNEGGAIYVSEQPSLAIISCHFKNCETKNDGAAIFLRNSYWTSSGRSVVIRRSLFDGNVAHERGGDIFLQDYDALIEGCIFRNSTSRRDGGSVQVSASSNITFTNCTFSNSSSKIDGGAVSVQSSPKASSAIDSSFTFKNCMFLRNTATKDGGGVKVFTHGALKFISCLFNGNTGEKGGGFYVQLGQSKAKEAQVMIQQSIFSNNRGKYGGAVNIARMEKFWYVRKAWKYIITPYSVAMSGIEFKDNAATVSGQSVYIVDHVEMKDSTVVTTEKYTASHLYLSKGDIKLTNVKARLHREKRYKLPSISQGVVFLSNNVQLVGNFTFVCPENFNVHEFQNNSNSRILSLARKSLTVYKDLTVKCIACPYGSYSLQASRLDMSEIGPYRQADIKKIKCIPCSSGAVCDVGVKSVDNFWGYKNSPTTLSFVLCPHGYCCGYGSVPCVSFNTCAGGRKGTLCGTCDENYKQNFVGGDCIPKGQECEWTMFVTYFVVYTVVYTAVFIVITNVKDIIAMIKSLVSKNNSVIETSEEDETEAPFSIPGFVQIVIFFYQIAGLLHIKFQDNQDKKKSSSSESIPETIADIFNFRFTVYQSVCPSDDLTLPQKEMILFALKLSTLVVLFFLFILNRSIRKMLSCRRPKFREPLSVRRNETATEEDSLQDVEVSFEEEPTQEELRTPSFSNMLKCTLIKLLKMYYVPIAKSALEMIYCVSILDRSHLYVYGDHVCYSNWQIAIMVIILPCIVVFPIFFEMALRLLKRRMISSGQFVLAVTCPFFGIILYLVKRKIDSEPQHTSGKEEYFRRTILEGEEVLFKEVEGRSVGWQIVQFYRTLAITAINVFITNPICRQLAYIGLLLAFVVHDKGRKPYKHCFLNTLQTLSSICLVIVVPCNVIPAVSYMVTVRAIPDISAIMTVFRVIELVVYATIPVSLLVWKLKEFMENRRALPEDQSSDQSKINDYKIKIDTTN